jgi:hypothetical protein
MTLHASPAPSADDQADDHEPPRHRCRRRRPEPDVPPSSWPGWAEVAEPLRLYLCQRRGRSLPELRAWAQARQLSGLWLFNELAWLANEGRAARLGEGKRLRWVATGQR